MLLVYGIWVLLGSESLRPYRFLGLLPILLAVAFVITNGRPYYAAGCYAAVIAAGAVGWTQSAARWRAFAAVPLVTLSVVLVVFSLPWKPELKIDPVKSQADAGLNVALYGKFGWRELRDATADAHQSLPQPVRDNAVIITDSYWQASALDVARQRYGLPGVYSPKRGFGYFGTPPDAATTVLWIGGKESDLRPLFDTITPIGHVDARLGYPEVTRDVTIWRCDHPRQAWSQAWPDMLRLD